MKLGILGLGQGGGKIADAFVGLASVILKNRRIRILAGGKDSPLSNCVYAINSSETDLNSLTNILADRDHQIAIDPLGHGAGKDNVSGAMLAHAARGRITGSLGKNRELWQADAILIVATTGGGTGSGGISFVTGLVKNMLLGEGRTRTPVYAMLVLPSEEERKETAFLMNTGRCLREMMANPSTDAIIVVDNEKFMDLNSPVRNNFERINWDIVSAWMDIACAAEETQPQYIGEYVSDVEDVKKTLDGISVIGTAHQELSAKRFSLLRVLPGGTKQKSRQEDQEERAALESLMFEGLRNLSADLSKEPNAYEAANVFGLVTGPPAAITEGTLVEMQRFAALHVPGAVQRLGNYPAERRTRAITWLISGISQGAVERILALYEQAEQRSQEQAGLEQSREELLKKLRSAGAGLRPLSPAKGEDWERRM